MEQGKSPYLKLDEIEILNEVLSGGVDILKKVFKHLAEEDRDRAVTNLLEGAQAKALQYAGSARALENAMHSLYLEVKEQLALWNVEETEGGQDGG